MDSLTRHALLARAASAQRHGRLPSLAVGMVRDGLEWFAGRGSVGPAAPTADTQYRIGSITKCFTAVLVMRLRDEGRLRLDDPIDRHVPDTELGGRTVGQLLSHTSGLRAETDAPWWERTTGKPWPELQPMTSQSPREHSGSAAFHYSNLGYAVLGQVVERHRSRSWWDVLQAEVLAPLGMTRTTFSHAVPAARGLAVHPWADVVMSEPIPETAAMAPAGQLWSTVADLAVWTQLLLGAAPDVLEPTTVEEMCQPIATSDLSPDAIGYGLGLSAFQRDGRTLVGHGGSMPGFVCGLAVDREERTGAVALCNATTGLDGDLPFDLLRLLREREPRVVDDWSPSPLPRGVDLDLTGVWHWGPMPFALRAVADGMLSLGPLQGTGRASRFLPEHDGRWRGLDGYYRGETLTVAREADGTPRALELASFVFTRDPYAPPDAIPGGSDPQGWHADHG
jgi:CubicO group peptidase (beta-lactamase class C family)